MGFFVCLFVSCFLLLSLQQFEHKGHKIIAYKKEGSKEESKEVG